MKEKRFLQILTEISLDPGKAKRSLSDKRLTLIEKLILEGYLSLRSNQNLEILASLEKIAPSNSNFVEGQRLLLLGVAYNNLSRYDLAKNYMMASNELIEESGSEYFHFLGLYTIFSLYANLEDLKMMKETLKKMSSYELIDVRLKAKMLRSQFCLYQMQKEDSLAIELCVELDKLNTHMSESDQIAYLVDKFIFQVQMEDFELAFGTLTEMKKHRKYQLTENYNFMKTLLDHLVKGSPIYAYECDFKKTPLLFHQLKVIQYMEERNQESATKHWNELKVEMKNVYLEDFKYQGSTCLFSLCLKKHMSLLRSKEDIKISNVSSKVDAVYSILKKSSGPVSASLIYEVIFGETPTLKEHLQKITRLVHRLKHVKNVNVKYHKGTYCLIADKIEKVS